MHPFEKIPNTKPSKTHFAKTPTLGIANCMGFVPNVPFVLDSQILMPSQLALNMQLCCMSTCLNVVCCMFHWPLTAQKQKSEEMRKTIEAQEGKITSLRAELQSTNQALGELSLAKETVQKEKVLGRVH